jgi:ribose transport system ATP-binding protein
MADGNGRSPASTSNCPETGAALEIADLSKTFSGQVVLNRVSMTVGQGEVHALVGQNGSGKSTLIKVLAGYHDPDPGASASVLGQALQLGSSTDAHQKNLRFVHQDLGLVDELSAVENLMLGRAYPTQLGVRIRWNQARRAAAETLARAGLDIDVRRPVGELSIADRTRLAIARALPEREDDRVVLVLDEPTAALPGQDVDRLFATIRRLRQDGHGIVLVSHHLDEILEISDAITVLRDGKKVGTVRSADVDAAKLTQLIVGYDLRLSTGRQEALPAAGNPVLKLEHLAHGSVADVSIHVHQGEVVGVAGLSGSGREVLASMITGRLPREGALLVDGKPVLPASPAAALKARLASVPGERARYGIFPNLNVRHNLTMGSLKRHVKNGHIDSGAERLEVRRWIEKLGIVTRGADAPITSLSGGNQQKVLVARALRLSPRVLVLDDPTAGIDVAARDQVHRIIEEGSADTMAVLLASTDSDELARLCDRVLIMSHGRVVRELRRGADLSAEAINHLLVSGAAA